MALPGRQEHGMALSAAATDCSTFKVCALATHTIEVSFTGYATAIFEEVTLKLGETFMLDVELKESATQLSEVTVIGDRSKFSGKKTGAITNISNTQLGIMPTIDRSLEDFTRLSPYSGAEPTLRDVTAG